MIRALVSTFVVCCLAMAGAAQTSQKAVFPGSLSLLPGYQIKPVHGIDSDPGEIWSPTGLRIGYDINGNAGSEADSVDKDNLKWRRELRIHGHRVLCVFTKEGELVVTFPYLLANFRAKVKNQQDMADMLLMVLSYEPVAGMPPEPTVDSAGPLTK